jgi:hypothetical protein
MAYLGFVNVKKIRGAVAWAGFDITEVRGENFLPDA